MFNYYKIGRILKPWRNDGVLIALHENGNIENLEDIQAIFININGNKVPFFLEEIEFNDDLIYIKFEEFKGPEDVKPHNGSELFVRDYDIQEDLNEEEADFEGFTIYDIVSGTTIIIEEIEQFPEQLMAKGFINDKEIFIPLIEEFILNIDFDQKRIEMDLPEGLLEL